MNDRQRWDERYATAPMPAPSAFLLASPLPPVGTALDLACGLGANARWLAARGWSVTAVDISAVALTRARKAADTEGLAITFVEADLATVEVPGDFSLVLSIGFYEPACLGWAAKRLPVGGMAVVETCAQGRFAPAAGALEALFTGFAVSDLGSGTNRRRLCAVRTDP